MNNEDLHLMNEIIHHIGNLNNENRLLLLVDYSHIAKTNLILLKGLLEELEKNGILVTVDRPHQYMEHLLRMHRINYANLFFLDTITTFSGAMMNQNTNPSNVRFLDSPFQIDLLPDLFSHSNNTLALKNHIDIGGLDFILIDNVASMLSYNDLDTVERFLENYLNKFRNKNSVFLPLIIDKSTHSSLYMTAKKWFDKEIDITSIKRPRMNINMKKINDSFKSQHDRILGLYSYRKGFTGGD